MEPTTSSSRPPPQHDPVRVMLIDRDHTVRDAIADLLELDPTISVVGEAATLDQALALLPKLGPDVVILDPRLPDGDGLQICRNLQATNAATRCLILTSETEPEAMLDAVHAGATGYMIKDLTELDLADAVKAIATGQSRLDGRAAPVLMHEFRRRHVRERELNTTLTTMETTILLLLAEGLTNRQIATRLFFTENTVRAYVAQLMRKLHLDDLTQTTSYTTQLREA